MLARLKLCVLTLCFGISSLGHAQTAVDKSAQNEIEQLRRTTALALITSLADEARNYQDEALRARVQARAAEALWKTDRDRANTLFYKAWETAEVVDKAAEQRNKEDRQKFFSGRGIGFISPLRHVRLEVLRFAARCDRELTDKFLSSLQEEKSKEGADVSNATESLSWDPTEPPLALSKRLELATLLLEGGDVEKALRFADPGLERVTKPGIIFLYKLRQVNSDAADKRFSALLARTSMDRIADANSISLLASYAFTPLVFATVTRNGRAYGGEPAPPPALSNETRAAFFRTAAQVLLRPVPAAGQDISSSGRAGTYFVISRVLPLFEKYAPERVAELNAQLVALAEDTPDALRNDYTMRVAGFNTEDPVPENADGIANELRRASSSMERDRIHLKALQGIIKTDPLRARELATKIEDVELRKGARALVDFIAVRTALDQKNTDSALRIIRSGDLSPIQSVWAYTEIAHLRKTDPIGTLELLRDAATEARRIDNANPHRVQALIAIAASFYEVDSLRAWDTMAEAVKAASYTDGFKGEAGRVTADLRTGNMVARFDLDVPRFDLNYIFSLLAKDDLQRAIELAKRFSAEEPRAIAIFAIARSVLEDKSKVTAPQ